MVVVAIVCLETIISLNFFNIVVVMAASVSSVANRHHKVSDLNPKNAEKNTE